MSNRLINLAKTAKLAIGRDGAVRRMFPSERSVLRELADDARDADGGRSRLGAAAIADLTGLSVRAVRYAIAALVRSGHVSRQVTQNGMTAITTVHPVRLAGPAGPLFGEGEMQADPPRPATATAPTEPPPAPDLGDERTQVYDAWNAMAARAGLPGTVTPDAARDAAVDQALAEFKLWRVLTGIRRVHESDFLCGRRHPGQSDWRASFDWFFTVRRHEGLKRLKQLLEGNWFADGPIPVEPPPEPMPTAPPRVAPPGELAGFVARVRARVGEKTFDAFAGDIVWSRDGADLIGQARTRFQADYVQTNFLELIRSEARARLGAATVRIIHEREKVMA